MQLLFANTVLLATASLIHAVPATPPVSAVRLNRAPSLMKRVTIYCQADGEPALNVAAVNDIINQLSAQPVEFDIPSGQQDLTISCLESTGVFFSLNAADPPYIGVFESAALVDIISDSLSICSTIDPGQENIPAIEYIGDTFTILIRGATC